MGMLSRIKRKELEGFKEFVTNLETTTEARRKEIIQVAVLEDPIYMSWVIKNITTAEEVVKLSSDQIEKIINNLPSGLLVMAKAFFNTPELTYLKEQVISRYMVADFNDYLASITTLKRAEQEGAQFLIMKVMRSLQAKEDIYGPIWQLPPVELMREDKMQSVTGFKEIKFDNGAIAAKGHMIKNHRHGEWHHFFENGKLMAKGTYDQGQKVGTWSFWYLNGKTKAEGSFKNDSKHGPWNEYDHEGNMVVAEYEEGKRL